MPLCLPPMTGTPLFSTPLNTTTPACGQESTCPPTGGKSIAQSAVTPTTSANTPKISNKGTSSPKTSQLAENRQFKVTKSAKSPTSTRKAAQRSPTSLGQSYLDIASHCDNSVLAGMEGVGTKTISKKINDAIHTVTVATGKFFMDVCAEFESARLKNGGHANVKAMHAALNSRAAPQLRAVRSVGSSHSDAVVPCKMKVTHSPNVCRKHPYCQLIAMQDATAAAYQSEQESSRRDSNFDKVST